MTLHKGKPSGINKPGNKATGVPSDFKPAHLKRDKKVRKKYITDEEKIAEGVKTKHPNRNVNKPNATNAGGYKN
jgi:hypothetical protein